MPGLEQGSLRRPPTALCLAGACVKRAGMEERRRKTSNLDATPTGPATENNARDAPPSTLPSRFFIVQDASKVPKTLRKNPKARTPQLSQIRVPTKATQAFRPTAAPSLPIETQGPNQIISVKTLPEQAQNSSHTAPPSPRENESQNVRDGKLQCHVKAKSMILQVNGCLERRVAINGCSGVCSSRQKPESTFFSSSNSLILSFNKVKKCRCCREKAFQLVPARLKCLKLPSPLLPAQQPTEQQMLSAPEQFRTRTFLIKQVVACSCKSRC